VIPLPLFWHTPRIRNDAERHCIVACQATPS
jgi:hypothetical protein